MSSNQLSSHEKLAHIRQLFEAGKPEKALQFIESTGTPTPELKNALGVCLMRLGRTERAMDVLRDIVFQKYMCIPLDTPPLFQANYATALVLKNYNQMAIEIIRHLPTSAHPYIAQLHQTIDQWQRSLPLFQRIRCWLKMVPNHAITLAVPPGDL